MNVDDIISHAMRLDSVIVLRPQPGDGSPEISWGDAFFYYAPGGDIPATQPFATIVTKDYPGEPASGLDLPGAFRLNIAVPKAEFVRIIGSPPRDAATVSFDAQVRDAWFPHPTYGGAGWLSVIEPVTQLPAALSLLEAAHRAAKARHERRTANRSAG